LLTVPGCEEPLGSRADHGHVEEFILSEDLQVHQVVGTVVAAARRVDRRAGVELLGDLVVDRQQRDRIGLVESESGEQVDDVGRDVEFPALGAPDLVMSELEPHCQPVAPGVGEADEEGLHDVVVGHAFGARGIQPLDGPGESTPSDGEPIGKLVQVMLERDTRHAGRIEVGREPVGCPTNPELHGSAPP
jgi:hypothetical protein